MADSGEPKQAEPGIILLHFSYTSLKFRSFLVILICLPYFTVCNFFRKPTKNKNIRKRNLNEDEGIEEEEQEKSSFLANKKKPLVPDNKLHFSTAPSKRLMVSEKSDVETKKDPTIFQFESSSEIQVQNDSRATATLETRLISQEMLGLFMRRFLSKQKQL